MLSVRFEIARNLLILIYCHVARHIKEFTQGSGPFTSF